MKWYENSDRRAQPVIVHVLITGQLITGQLITGQLITEQLISGQLITGPFITRWFITDSQGEYCGDRQDKTDECEEGKDDDIINTCTYPAASLHYLQISNVAPNQ